MANSGLQWRKSFRPFLFDILKPAVCLKQTLSKDFVPGKELSPVVIVQASAKQRLERFVQTHASYQEQRNVMDAPERYENVEEL